MIEFFSFFGFVFLGLIVYRAIRAYLSIQLEETQSKLIADLTELSKIIHTVKEETIGNVIYWFDAETDKFIGQGATHDDIIDILKKHYLGHIFLISDTEMLAGPNFDVIALPPSIRKSKTSIHNQ
jgi:hypothetical protein